MQEETTTTLTEEQSSDKEITWETLAAQAQKEFGEVEDAKQADEKEPETEGGDQEASSEEQTVEKSASDEETSESDDSETEDKTQDEVEDDSEKEDDQVERKLSKVEKGQKRLNRNWQKLEERNQRLKDEREAFEAERRKVFAEIDQYRRAKEQELQKQRQFADPRTWDTAADQAEKDGNLDQARIFRNRADDLRANPVTIQNGMTPAEQQAAEQQRIEGVRSAINSSFEEHPELKDTNSAMNKAAMSYLNKWPQQAWTAVHIKDAVDYAEKAMGYTEAMQLRDENNVLRKELEKLKRSTTLPASPKGKQSKPKSINEVSSKEGWAMIEQGLKERGMD